MNVYLVRNKYLTACMSYSKHIVPVARLEAFRALKLSRLESFRVLKGSARLESFRALKLSDFESFRALKASNLATGTTSFPPEVNFSDGTQIECVPHIKLLGVIVSQDLRWNLNTEYIYA